MTLGATWTGPTSAAAPDQSGYRPHMRLTFTEVVLQLWRAKWLMLLVFLPIFSLGMLVAFAMPKQYEATSRLYVSLGEEYVYRPRVGSVAAGSAPEQEQVIQSELELLQSPVVAQRVLKRFPLDRLYPDLAARWAKALSSQPGASQDAEFYLIEQLGVAALTRDFAVGTAPKTPVIHTSFKHRDPGVSAEVLNAMIGAYLQYRTEIFNSGAPDIFTSQRKRFELDLLSVEDEIRQFLTDNRIGDFEAERKAAQTLYATMSDDLFKTEGRISALRGQLVALRQQVGETSPLVDIFIEDSTEQALLDLQLERQQLLSRYKSDSRPVQAVDAQIEQVRTYLAAQSGAVGTVRRGPNPVYQDMETRMSTLEAELAAILDHRRALIRQRDSIESRQKRIAELEPGWQQLLRKRDLLTENVRNFASREMEARTLTELARQDADNIRILEPAMPPARGKSLKLPVAVLSLLFAGFTALMIGLLQAFTRRGLATANSVERRTGLPVIATISKRR